jgi:membrane protein
VSDDKPGFVARVQAAVSARAQALRARYVCVRHVVSAWGLLQRNNGNQYAAAISYFSFLALFPMLLLAVAITGFVLHSHPAAETSLFNHITQKVPGSFGTTLKSSLQTAINQRTGVGIVGLLGLLLTGLGWVANLRGAIDAVWGRPQVKANFLTSRLANLFVLAGLGLGILVSLGLTVVGTSLTDQILQALSLDHLPGFTLLLKVLGIAIAIAGDVVIFWWLLIRLPQADVPERVAIKGALLASIGFEILKIVGTYTIAHTANSPTAGPFAGVVAVLVWIQLVARFMLFSCAWTATLAAEHQPASTEADVQPVVDADFDEPTAISPAAVGVTLVGAGAVAGAVAAWAATRPRPTPKVRS